MDFYSVVIIGFFISHVLVVFFVTLYVYYALLLYIIVLYNMRAAPYHCVVYNGSRVHTNSYQQYYVRTERRQGSGARPLTEQLMLEIIAKVFIGIIWVIFCWGVLKTVFLLWFSISSFYILPIFYKLGMHPPEGQGIPPV